MGQSRRGRARAWLACTIGGAALWFAASASADTAQLTHVDIHFAQGRTRVVFNLSSVPKYHYFRLGKPPRAVIDLDDTAAGDLGSVAPKGAVSALRIARHKDGTLRAVIDLADGASLADVASHGHELVASVTQGAAASTDAKAATKVASQDNGASEDKTDRASRSSHQAKAAAGSTGAPKALYKTARDQGPIVVVIDPGHGGHDSGTRAASGLMEKTAVLAIAKRLDARLKATPGMQPILTRNSDRFLTLRERVRIAQKNHANLFVSIHANAFPDDHSVKGGTCYMLSEHGATDAKAAQVAHFENTRDRSLAGVKFSGDPTLNAVLTDLFQNASISDANDVATDIIHEYAKIGPIYGSKPPRANFAVLRDPMIPSVLCETAFLSNPQQARAMATAHFRNALADAMYNGIMRYFKAHPPEEMTATVGSLYTVKSGETLSEIAARQGVSENALMSINHLHSKTLRAGQKLQLPNAGR